MRLLALSLILFCTACASSSQKGNSVEEETTIWVNSYKVDCWVNAPSSCLQIQSNETINADEWQDHFYEISGFDFIPGYLSKLKVKMHMPDPSAKVGVFESERYTLIEVLEQEEDKMFRLHDLWSVKTINGSEFEHDLTVKRPFLEINAINKTFMGNGTCNNASGIISAISDTVLVFDNIVSTKMACSALETENEYFKALNESQTYAVKNLMLYLYNADGKEVLSFIKVD